MLKFAVVREDPAVELALARQAGAQRVLTVASGGCTALALKHALPAVDPRPAQRRRGLRVRPPGSTG